MATRGRAYGVFVSGNHAFVADWNSGLHVVVFSTLGQPREVGYLDTLGKATGVFVYRGYAFVADWDGGLVVARVDLPGV
jgi:hypothetical protein